jgi:hypothetical protein
LCAAGVSAPHIRQRLYIVAVADGQSRRVHVPRGKPRGALSEIGGGSTPRRGRHRQRAKRAARRSSF